MADLCEQCWFNSYDEESGKSLCNLQLDEDEYIRLLSDFNSNRGCQYFRPDTGEYGIVRKQN